MIFQITTLKVTEFPVKFDIEWYCTKTK